MLLIFALIASLTACDQQAMIDKIAPQQEVALVKQLFAQLAARDYESVEKQLDPSLQTPTLRGALEDVAGQFPAGPPLSIRIIGSRTQFTTDTTIHDLTLEYEYSGSWLIGNAVLRSSGASRSFIAFRVTPRAQSLVSENAFSLGGKSPAHYLVLLGVVLIPLFVLIVLVLCIRTKSLKRKWAWILFVLLGLVQFSFNWTTGEWSVQPIAVLLFGSGFASAGPAAPLVFSLGLPVGAMVFMTRWLRRERTIEPPVAS